MELQMNNPLAIKHQYMEALNQIRTERDVLEEHRQELSSREEAGKFECVPVYGRSGSEEAGKVKTVQSEASVG